MKPTELEGIIVGKDKIPVIEDVVQQLSDKFDNEQMAQASSYIKNNKHN